MRRLREDFELGMATYYDTKAPEVIEFLRHIGRYFTQFVPQGERIAVIEDSREVQVQREHVFYLEARPSDPEGRGAVSIRDLFRATLRMRPDRIIIGEIRGAEALDIIQAMVSGHGGCLGTLHATHPRDTLTQ